MGPDLEGRQHVDAPVKRGEGHVQGHAVDAHVARARLQPHLRSATIHDTWPQLFEMLCAVMLRRMKPCKREHYLAYHTTFSVRTWAELVLRLPAPCAQPRYLTHYMLASSNTSMF